MNIITYFPSLFLLLFLPFTFNNSNEVVGHTKISFAVGGNGEARASIPINISKGTILQPSLSVAYNSQGGNGLLGLGWNLDGITQTITRVPATMAQDGFIDGVDFDNSDRFALNGERLIAIVGNYGDNLAVYQTEQNNFSSIISYGDTGNGPQDFKVRTKDGLLLEFGSVENARIGLANASNKILIWLLNKISDTNGNYIIINYHNGIINGEYRPLSIEYTGNSNLGKAPYNKVEFFYEDRPDIFTRYLAGHHSTFTKRLKTIVARDHNQLLRRYELEYVSGIGVSKLRKVTEFGSDNASCLNPITINWIRNTLGAYDFNKGGTGFWAGHGGGTGNNAIGDFNGDGRTDLAGYSPEERKWHVSLSAGNQFNNVWWSGHNGGLGNNVVGDFNGDGLTDLAGYSTVRNEWHVSLSTGNGFNNVWWGGHSGGIENNVAGDFNGDGRTDLASFIGNGQWDVSLSTGNNFNTIRWQGGHGGGASNNVVGDFNGDGRADLAGYSTAVNKWHVSLSTGNGFFSEFWQGHIGGINNNVVGDFNGDGLTDLAGFDLNKREWHVSLSTGDAFYSTFWQGHIGGSDNNITGDFNGDGRTDLAGFSGNGQWHVSLSTGKNFYSEFWDGHGGGSDNNVIGDFNGDGMTDIAGHSPGNGWHVALSNAKKELVDNIVHGNGLVSVFEYKPITNADVYTKGNNAVYPQIDFTGALYVAASFSANDGQGGRRRRTYEYSNAKYDYSGRGFRGFEEISMVDHSAGTHIATFYDRDFRRIGASVKKVTHKTLDGRLLKVSENVPEHVLLYDRVYFSYYSSTTDRYYELDGTLYNQKTTEFSYDQFGNAINIKENYKNGAYIVETKNTFTNDANKWRLGRLTQAIVEKSLYENPKTVKKSTFEYDVNGNLVKETLLPDHSTKRLETVYTLDAFGNRVEVTQSGPDIQTRSDHFTFDSDGRNVVEEKNPLGHTLKHTYSLGYLHTSEDANGFTTTYTRDVFGRDIRVDFHNGLWETVSYNKCGDCPADAVYYLENRATGTGYSRTYFDKLDREIRNTSEGFSGALIHQDTRYNADGTVHSVSDPYFEGQTAYWTIYDYDVVKRLIKETRPGNEITSYSYSGLSTSLTNSQNQTSTRIENPMGDVELVRDPFESEMYFAYDNDRNLIERIDFYENSIGYTYDERGFKTGMDDPNMGQYSYEYNTLGQLVSQTQPNNETVQFEYDLLNRVVKKTEPEGVTEWAYDPVNGIGNVKSIAFDGALVESYSYNPDGRLQSETYIRDNTDKTFTYVYDSKGFLSSETYPNNYQVRYAYNSRGFLHEVVEHATGLELWKANNHDADNRLVSFTLGNGLTTVRNYNDETGDLRQIATGSQQAQTSIQDLRFTFSKLGNLTQRRDINLDRTEDFTYDNLNRLTTAAVAGLQPLEVQYDLFGNIAYKSDVGHYNYGENGRGHQTLTSIDHSQTPGCVYNLNHDLTYTSYNYVSSIRNQNTRIEIEYGPQRGRTKLRTFKDGQLETAKTYMGGSYEEVEDANGVITTVCYLSAGSEVFGFASKKGDEPNKITYMHTDHIGSVNVLTAENGSILQRFSFDAWGKQRDAFTWENLSVPSDIPPFARGFTFHEMLDMDWLICMNARVYSPVLGRFLSPDPFIQFGENMQSHNRFAYVLNNPLSFTDPSGYGILDNIVDGITDLIKDNAGTLVGIAISLATFNPLGAILSGAAGGFGGAFTDALLAGGSFSESFKMGLDGGLWGAISAGITHGIGSAFAYINPNDKLGLNLVKGVIHGLAQGGITEARGGDFGAGFLNGAIPSVGMAISGELNILNTPDQRIVVGAALGGTASQLSGGKFANGALTGAFIAIYNENAHDNEYSQSEFDWGDAAWLAVDIATIFIPGGVFIKGGIWLYRGYNATKGAGQVTKAYKYSFKYAKRVRTRALQDPVSHNFPYSFDDTILKTQPILKNNGYKIFQKAGTMNGKNGVFEIGLTKNGVVDHRFFRPY